MDGKPRGGFRSDEGMSVLEIVVAAFIMFFVLTAVLGLTWATTRMSIDAKQRNVMTNVISSQMEYVRSLDFEKVQLAGTGEGVIAPVRVIEVEGFKVTITTAVSSASGGTREVLVTLTSERAGYETITTTQFMALRDKDAIAKIVTNQGPVVEFTSATPVEDTVVYSNFTYPAGTSLWIGAKATANGEGVDVTEFNYYCSGSILRDGTTVNSAVAAWTPNVPVVEKTFRWDTKQVNDQGQLAIADGWQTVRVEATDEQSLKSYKDRRFYVDNYAPGSPGAAAGEVANDTETRVSWTPAMDGTVETWGYNIWIKRYDLAGNLNAVTPAGAPILTDSAAYVHVSGVPFSRYLIDVQARSPRLMVSAVVPGSAYVTRPRASGTSRTVYSGKNAARKADTTVSLTVTTPTFKTTATPVYDVYRGLTPTSLTLFKANSGTAFTEVITKTVGKNGTPDPFYYQYRATFTPTGGSQQVVLSNVIGPVSVLDNVLETMAHVRW